MRKFLLAASLLALGLSSCTKEQTIINTEPAKPPYRISGLSDILVQFSPFYTQPIIAQQQISVVYEYGDQKRVSLSIENLPAGMKDSFYVRSGYPDFNTYVAFYNQGVKAGNYTSQVVLQADGDSIARRYPFNITIQGDTSCIGYFGGKSFDGTSNCSGMPPNPNPSAPYKVFSARLNGSDTLVLNNFKGDGTGLKVFINCRNTSVEIPMQIIGNNVVQGSGQIIGSNGGSSLPDVIYLNVTERNSQGNITYCNYYLQLN